MGLNNVTAISGMFVIAQDGTGNFAGNTDEAWQAGIDYLEANGGGSLYIKPGTYTVNSKITKKTDYDIRIYGHGRSTILKAKNNLNDHLISVTGDNFFIANMTIDGNGTNQTSTTLGDCINASSVDNFQAENIKIINISRRGIALESCTCSEGRYIDASGATQTNITSGQLFMDKCTDSGFVHCISHDAVATNRAGFTASDSTTTHAYAYTGAYFKDCEAHHCQYGFYTNYTVGNTFQNCTAHDNTASGFFIYNNYTNTAQTILNNVRAYDNTQSGFQILVSSNIAGNNIIAYNNTGHGLNVTTATYNTFTNVFISTNLKDGIHLETAATNNTFTGGFVYNNGNSDAQYWGINEIAGGACSGNAFTGIRVKDNGTTGLQQITLNGSTEVSHCPGY